MRERRVQSVMGRDRQRMSMACRRRGVALDALIAKFRYRFYSFAMRVTSMLWARHGRTKPLAGLLAAAISRSEAIDFVIDFSGTGRLR